MATRNVKNAMFFKNNVTGHFKKLHLSLSMYRDILQNHIVHHTTFGPFCSFAGTVVITAI